MQIPRGHHTIISHGLENNVNKTKFFIKHYSIQGVGFFDIVRWNIDYLKDDRVYYEWIPYGGMNGDVFFKYSEVDWRLL